MTRHTAALTLALMVLALWLLWAARQDGGAHGVLLTAGLWWGAALRATWRVWVPAVVVLAGLYAAIPPRHRRQQPRRVAALAVSVAEVAPTQEPKPAPTPETPPAVVPAPVPARPLTVWEAFASPHQERDDGATA